MNGTWIVGVDDSEAAVTAVRWAERFTSDRDISITAMSVWHVARTIQLLGAKRGFDVDEMGLAAEAGVHVDRALDRTREDAVGRGDRLVSAVVEGRPGPTLVEAARDAEALVVGRHGHEPWHHGLGSVSRYCATHASGPVIVVPESASMEPVTRVVVGFDGGDGSRLALRWAEDNAPTDAEITAYGIVEGPPWLGLERARERYGDAVEEDERRLRDAFAECEASRTNLELTMGDARVVLLDASDEADLVVIGGPSHGRLGTVILGSTATWLLHATTCPVVIAH